ncbi:hypothetical protein ABBQ38_006135 [Trebouxia sp. C0009 RCD-2024]
MSANGRELSKDPQFLCGVALSVYQNSGDPNSNWAWYEKQKSVAADLQLSFSSGDTSGLDASQHNGTTVHTSWKNMGKSVIMNNERIGKSSDFWNNYEQDIRLAKELGSNAFRLSLEWSRIMPSKGHIDQAAVKRYHQMFDCIDKHNMEANVTLHWFVHPRWFDELGGWRRSENVRYYVQWAELAFKLWGSRSKLWATFNEPGVFAMCSYVAANHPPGMLMQFKDAGMVLLHMLRAHAAAYRVIKQMPGGKDVMVGLVHNVFWTEPKGTGIMYAHVRAACRAGNRVWGNETVMRYLKEGVFHHWLPPCRHLHWRDPLGKPGCDWFGINHYARGIVGLNLQPSSRGPRGVTEMGYPMYPPSLFRAIHWASKLGVPMYITENGTPLTEDTSERSEWITGYLEQVEKAVEEGYDVRGFMYWTLVDNFEWAFAYELKFGLYEFNPEWGDTSKRRLKEGSKVIKKHYAELPDKLGRLLANQKRSANSKSETEKESEDDRQEAKFLREEGFSKDEIEDALPDEDPVTAGTED